MRDTSTVLVNRFAYELRFGKARQLLSQEAGEHMSKIELGEADKTRHHGGGSRLANHASASSAGYL